MVNKNLQGKLALVTGASRGLGKQMAIELASRGADLMITYSKSKSGADEVVKQIEGLGQKAIAVQLDTSLKANIDNFIPKFKQELKTSFNRENLDILVNNAGISGNATASTMTEAAFDELFNVNVKSVFFLINGLEKTIKDGGSIVNLSSSLTNHSYSFDEYMVYSSTKGAINILTRDFAVHLGKRNIRVNAVAPGATLTDMTKDFLTEGESSDNVKSITALNRIGQPTDIAPVVAFLASDDSRWVTGEVIETSGGAHL